MTSNLRRKSYVFRGEQLSKEEYGKRLAAEDLGSYQAVQRLWKEFDALVAGSIRPHGTFKNAVNTTGNGVANTSDCSYVFHGTELENCHYAIFLDNANDCMDINNGGHGMELVYETCTAGAGAYNSKFCVDAWPEVSNLTYCDSCRSGAADLFGCISLRGKQYCILNKQYSKEEYRDLVGRIMQQMKEVPYRDKNGRVYVYGEFFPSELSPFPYNDSMAQDFFQLTPETAEAQGFRWNAQIEKNVRISTPAESLPDHIRDVDDAILNEVVGCLHKGECNDRCSVGFRITPDELRFYRRYDIPLPRLCPNCRSYVRLKRRNPFTLWDRQCMCDKGHAQHLGGRCDITFKTNCIPEKGETVYCEHCYNLEVS